MALLVRQRRHQPALSLPLPLQLEASSSTEADQWNANAYPLPMLSNGPDSPIVETLSDLGKLEVLGRGNGGTVYKVQHRKNSRVYALKVIRFEPDSAPIRKKAVREAEILKQLDSEFLIKCYGVFECSGSSDNGTLCFLLEYMERGSLKDVMETHGTLPENIISCVAKRVLEGLSYLHGLNIVHRDIKPSNLLMNADGEVKIADFGVSRVVQGTVDANDSCEGTCAYMSPERFDSDDKTQCDDFAGDVWALGLALLECYMGHFPLVAPGEKPDWATLYCAICCVEPPEIPKTASSNFKSFIYRCLEKDWKRRATVSELLCHPFVVNSISSNQTLDSSSPLD